METLDIKMVGKSALLMNNVRMVDPLDPHTIAKAALTKKRGPSRTEDDLKEIAKAEFLGKLQHEPDIGPYVHARSVVKCLVEGARMSKAGGQIERGVVVLTDRIPLQYKGPRDVQGLWDAQYFARHAVGIGDKKVMIVRPQFRSWSIDVEFVIDETQVDRSTVVGSVARAGAYKGFMDGRSIGYGRFAVEVL